MRLVRQIEPPGGKAVHAAVQGDDYEIVPAAKKASGVVRGLPAFRPRVVKSRIEKPQILEPTRPPVARQAARALRPQP
jgi:hypothetical protein